MDHKQQQQSRKERLRDTKMPGVHEIPKSQEGVLSIPVVRTNTPRPSSFESMLSSAEQLQEGQRSEPIPSFPIQAPLAPPLPEELGERENGGTGHAPASAVLSGQPTPSEEAQDFAWLFEYGLEMDAAMLNSPRHLGGLALFYGPAALKGYTRMFGQLYAHGRQGSTEQTIATIVPNADTQAEVWGILYRIPRRLIQQDGRESSLLDTVHATQLGLFKAIPIVVREVYRDREVTCLTYIATENARRQLLLFPLEQGTHTAFVQRLADLMKRLKLPETHLSSYAPSAISATPALHAIQDTDPLPALQENSSPPVAVKPIPKTPKPRITSIMLPSSRRLIVFAIYLVIVLLVLLTFAIFQGLGFANTILTANFTLLGVPWLVLFYGLLGGCISSLVTLGRYRLVTPPMFVIITWFTRPYIGAVLALLSYLFLTSGIFVLTTDSGRPSAIFLLAGAIAGLCEGWIFFRRG